MTCTESCRVCGVVVPRGQHGICSVCYGDPEWGSDGYLAASMRASEEKAAELERERERELEDRKLASRYEPVP